MAKTIKMPSLNDLKKPFTKSDAPRPLKYGKDEKVNKLVSHLTALKVIIDFQKHQLEMLEQEYKLQESNLRILDNENLKNSN